MGEVLGDSGARPSGPAMNDVVTDRLALARVSVPKAGDVLAAQLRGRIRSGDIREGQVLPAERELVDHTGLSRTSVREALRILEHEGLIEIRPGRNGGSRVRRPAGADLSRHLELFIWGRKVGFADLHDVREALEALAAAGAARRRDDADLADLIAKTEAVEDNVGDIDRYLEANLAWHMAVVRASHNDLLVGIMSALSNAIHQATEIEAFDSPEVHAATIKIHRAILAAIQDGDADAARRRMARHVAAAGHVAMNAAGDNDGSALEPVAAGGGQRRSAAGAGATGKRASRTPGKGARRSGTVKASATPKPRAAAKARALPKARAAAKARATPKPRAAAKAPAIPKAPAVPKARAVPKTRAPATRHPAGRPRTAAKEVR